MQTHKSFIYNADCYCEDCGNKIRDDITTQGFAPDDPDDERSYDSDEFPKGPFSKEECDTPQHCAAQAECLNAIEFDDGTKVGALLDNELTSCGVRYVQEYMREDPSSEVVKIWVENFIDYFNGKELKSAKQWLSNFVNSGN